MAFSEDDIALAAEYALGTLGADERAEAERMMAADGEFADLVRSWEWRLGALNQMVGLVEPRPVVWDNIKGAIAEAGPEAPAEPAEAAPPEPQSLPSAEAAAERAAPPPSEPVPPLEPEIAAPSPEPVMLPPEMMAPAPEPTLPRDEPAARPAEPASAIDESNIIRLDRAAQRWRAVARLTSALAAALVVLIGLQIFAPDYLPDSLRPTPRTKVVQVKPPVAPTTPAAQYVALLQGQGGDPAFILTVDGASRTFTVRRVGAAPADPGKSYELWLISDKLGRPRSLGVIGATDFTVSPTLAAYDADTVNNAIYAVTVEQAGGSPDGNPHAAPVYSGRLIETVPPLPVPSPQPQKR